MTKHTIKFRLHCDYKTEKNDVVSLLFEHQVKNQWQEYDPHNHAKGFLILLYAIFNCQHLYFRINAAERGIQLKCADGALEAETDDHWRLQKLHIHFDTQLASTIPTNDDEAYIVDRMMHCPVSINIKAPVDMRTTLHFFQPITD
ncbi:MAG: hypothetical protein PVJ39_06825 [Gammaproteobacteria bacterium]|jgi:hypothetical protein